MTANISNNTANISAESERNSLIEEKIEANRVAIS